MSNVILFLQYINIIFQSNACTNLSPRNVIWKIFFFTYKSGFALSNNSQASIYVQFLVILELATVQAFIRPPKSIPLPALRSHSFAVAVIENFSNIFEISAPIYDTLKFRQCTPHSNGGEFFGGRNLLGPRKPNYTIKFFAEPTFKFLCHRT